MEPEDVAVPGGTRSVGAGVCIGCSGGRQRRGRRPRRRQRVDEARESGDRLARGHQRVFRRLGIGMAQ